MPRAIGHPQFRIRPATFLWPRNPSGCSNTNMQPASKFKMDRPGPPAQVLRGFEASLVVREALGALTAALGTPVVLLPPEAVDRCCHVHELPDPSPCKALATQRADSGRELRACLLAPQVCCVRIPLHLNGECLGLLQAGPIVQEDAQPKRRRPRRRSRDPEVNRLLDAVRTVDGQGPGALEAVLRMAGHHFEELARSELARITRALHPAAQRAMELVEERFADPAFGWRQAAKAVEGCRDRPNALLQGVSRGDGADLQRLPEPGPRSQGSGAD